VGGKGETGGRGVHRKKKFYRRGASIAALRKVIVEEEGVNNGHASRWENGN